MIESLPALVQSAKQAQSATGAEASAQTTAKFKVGLEEDFASVLANVAEQATNRIQSAEATSAAALKGEADTREVVDAVMSAEQTLQTAIAIRDKIVTAYLEISRMAI